MKQMMQEIERLNGFLQKFTAENEELKGNLTINSQKLGNELNAAKNTISEY